MTASIAFIQVIILKVSVVFLEGHDYSVWSKNKEKLTDKEELTDNEKSTAVQPMPPLEGDEEKVKEGKQFKILTPNKLLARLPILLLQIKARNNSKKKWNQTNTIFTLSTQ